MQSRILLIVFVFSSIISIGQEFNTYDSNGKRHGKWRKTHEKSNKLRYEGTFDHGKEIGAFKFYKSTDNEYPTAIKVFSKDHDTVAVKYFTQKRSVISEGKMVGKEHTGVWKYYHNQSSKIMMTENYENGKLHGEQLTYFTNGKLTEKISYVEGERQGKRVVYSEEGKILKEYTYVDDKLEGATKFYDPTGKLLIEGNYKNDRKDGVWNYYEEEKLSRTVKYPLRNNRN